jgi:tRNA(adenine34) deaminase
MKKEEKFMLAALKEADKAEQKDEVPVGCVIVLDDKIIARGHNMRETSNLATAHAEVMAITKANRKLKSWRLENCDLYVTVEPCLMCAGTIIQSRIRKVCYGAKDYKGGAFGSSINVLDASNINHHPEIVGGVLEAECSSKITNYFKKKRQSK